MGRYKITHNLRQHLTLILANIVFLHEIMRANQNAIEGAFLLSQQFFRGVSKQQSSTVSPLKHTKCHVFSET